MIDQAHQLRQLAHEATPRIDAQSRLPPTIVVAGGKGGVGTSTVAVNLAAALAQGGRRTVLVDAAPNADATKMLGTEFDRGAGFADVLSGTCLAADALRPAPAGILLLAGEWSGERRTALSSKSINRLVDQLRSLGECTDAIVIDAGSGTNLSTPFLWLHAAMVLLVTTPDDVSVVDAYAMLKLGIADECVDVRVLVNQCHDTATATEVQSRLAAACRRFLSRTIGRAPMLPKHAVSSDACAGAPLAWDAPTSAFARSVRQLGRFAGDVLARYEPAKRELQELLPC